MYKKPIRSLFIRVISNTSLRHPSLGDVSSLFRYASISILRLRDSHSLMSDAMKYLYKLALNLSLSLSLSFSLSLYLALSLLLSFSLSLSLSLSLTFLRQKFNFFLSYCVFMYVFVLVCFIKHIKTFSTTSKFFSNPGKSPKGVGRQLLQNEEKIHELRNLTVSLFLQYSYKHIDEIISVC